MKLPKRLYKFVRQHRIKAAKKGWIVKCFVTEGCDGEVQILSKNLGYRCAKCRKSLSADKWTYEIAAVDPLFQWLMDSILFVDMNDEDGFVLFNNKSAAARKFPPRRIAAALRHPILWDWFQRERIEHAAFDYNPLQRAVYLAGDQVPTYNLYHPPLWKRDAFYRAQGGLEMRDLIPGHDSLPPVYDTFLRHFVGNNEASFHYVIDWLANSLQGRNYTYLIAIGNQGVGKGTLGEILRKLHGDSNYRYVSDKILKGRFNAEVKHRTLIYIDEVHIEDNDKEALNRFKALVNPQLEIEGKGKDSITVENFTNYYLTSNHTDAIPLEGDDRRYSFIHLGPTALKDSTELLRGRTIEDYCNELLNDNNIDAFAHYLYHKNIQRNMHIPFVDGDKIDDIKDASLKNWQRWIMEEYFPARMGQTLRLRDIQDALKLELGIHMTYGRNHFDKLRRLFPNKFTLRWDYKIRERVVYVHNEGEDVAAVIPDE